MPSLERPGLRLQQIVEGRLVVGCRLSVVKALVLHCRDVEVLLLDAGVADPNRLVGGHH